MYQPYTQQLYPHLWRDCHLTPYLHAFYQSLEPLVPGEKEHSPGKLLKRASHTFQEFPGHERPPHFSSIQVHASPSDSKEINSSSLSTLEAHRHLELAFQTRLQSPGLCFYGQLTDTGKRNMLSLGSRLRHVYIDKLKFLKERMDLQDLYVRSTDYSRTIESVQYLLGGLYPFSKRDQGQDMTIHIRSALAITHPEQTTRIRNHVSACKLSIALGPDKGTSRGLSSRNSPSSRDCFWQIGSFGVKGCSRYEYESGASRI